MSDKISRTGRRERKKDAANVRIDPVTDGAIFQYLYEYRLLRTSNIAMLTGRSVKAVNARLRKLKNKGYLDYIDPKLERKHKPNPEALYALGNDGRAWLFDRLSMKVPKTSMTDLNRTIGYDSVTHTLAINDFVVRVRNACENDPSLRFISQHEIISGLRAKKHLKEPLKLSAKVAKKTESTVADFMLGIEDITRPEGQNKMYFFGEADRGTMQQSSAADPSKSANADKFAVYYQWWKDKKYDDEFNIPNFRVLFYTLKTEVRVNNLRAFVEHIVPGGSAQWLFASTDSLFSAENILYAPWTNGKGIKTTMVPPTS